MKNEKLTFKIIGPHKDCIEKNLALVDIEVYYNVSNIQRDKLEKNVINIYSEVIHFDNPLENINDNILKLPGIYTYNKETKSIEPGDMERIEKIIETLEKQD